MANVKLVFYGNENSDGIKLTTYVNFRGELFIQIESEGCPPEFITLDKSTAIKFAKTVRSEINKMNHE